MSHLGRSSGWLGAVSDELDGRGGGHRSSVRSGGVSRARARAGLREMRRGSECGLRRGSKRRWGVGRATWLRIPATCTSACSLVHGRRGEGGADWGGPRHREREGVGCNGSASGRTGPRGREGRGAWGGKQLAPTSWPHWTERGRGEARGAETAADRWRPPVRRRGRAAWLGRAGLFWARMAFPFS